eukprot:g6414.t1
MAAFASRWEADLEPGELIFVPAGCAHQVVNLVSSVAVAMNFVDAGNVARVAAEMARKADAAVGTAQEYYGALAGSFSDADRFPRAEALLARAPETAESEPASLPLLYADWKINTQI